MSISAAFSAGALYHTPAQVGGRTAERGAAHNWGGNVRAGNTCQRRQELPKLETRDVETRKAELAKRTHGGVDTRRVGDRLEARTHGGDAMGCCCAGLHQIPQLAGGANLTETLLERPEIQLNIIATTEYFA